MKLAILASGTGRTLLNLIQCHQRGELLATPYIVIVDRICKAQDISAENDIIWFFSKDSEDIFNTCREHEIGLVALAGFLRKLTIPPDYENKVLNIHPAINMQKYGGKGFYGHHVHEAVIKGGEKVSGCTIHYASQEYDRGDIIAQKEVPVLPDDTPETLAARVFEAEKILYPEVINKFVLTQ